MTRFYVTAQEEYADPRTLESRLQHVVRRVVSRGNNPYPGGGPDLAQQQQVICAGPSYPPTLCSAARRGM